MIATLPRITAAVRVALGMDPLATPLLADAPETLDFERRVRQLAPQAALNLVQTMTTARLCGSGHSFADAPVDWQRTGDDCWAGMVDLPDDFCRLVSFRLDGWQTSVHTASCDVDPTLYSPWPGIAGGMHRPRCSVVPGRSGLRLCFGGIPSPRQVVEAEYFPVPRLDADGGLLLPDDSLSDLVDQIVALLSH